MEQLIQKKQITLAGFIIAFVGAVLFSTKAIIVKKAFINIDVDALTLLTIRMVFSLPFYLIAAFAVSSGAGNVKLNKQQWITIIFLGLAGYYISSLFDFIGLQYISAGLERLILFLYPTFAVLINAFFYKEKMHTGQKIALLFTYLGIAIAYYGEMNIDTSNPNFFWGSFLVFICAITYSMYIVGSGRIIPLVGATKFTAYAMLTATAGIFIHFLLRGDTHTLFQSSSLWGYGIALALIATVIPSFMLSAALKRIGSNNVAIISSVGPVSTIIQAHYFLGEKIFAEQIVGTALVLCGILILSYKKGKEA